MPSLLSLRILLVSVLTVIAFNVLSILVPLPLYVRNAQGLKALYGGAMILAFMPLVSLITAMLGQNVKHRAAVIWISSVWLAYWVLVIGLYSLTKGR